MLGMLLPLTPMDMLPMLDTHMLLDMLELMVLTTLARDLLMLSLKLRLMLSMVPMDILHMLLLMLMDTQDILDTLATLMLPMVLLPMVPTLTWDKKKCFFLQKFMKRKVFILCPSIKSKTVMNFNFNILLTASDYLS